MRAKGAAVAVVMSQLAWTAGASAEPQANIAVTTGVAGRGTDAAWWSETKFHLGGRADVLFGRERNLDFGWGPYAETLTSFDDLTAGGGISALVPIHPYLPAVLSAGGYAWNGPDGGWEPGVTGQLFWGSRSFNYHSWYVMAGGLALQARWGLGDSKERTIIIAAHIDGEILALPFLMLFEAVSGPSAE